MKPSCADTPRIHAFLKSGLSRDEIKEKYGYTARQITMAETEFGKVLSEKEIRERWKQIIPEIKCRFREEILEMDNNP